MSDAKGMFMTIDLVIAVEDFWIARKRGEFFPRAYHDKLTSDDAYRIQLALIDRRVAALGLGVTIGHAART
jgi:hypothetical protein